MARYHVQTLVFENGERYPILMGEDDMPHFYITLWVTTKLRSEGKAVNTISNKLEHVKWFLIWQDQEKRNIYDEFKSGNFLQVEDIQNIKSFLKLDISHLKKSSNKNRNKIVNINSSPTLIEFSDSVGSNHHYNRMTSVIEYLVFLARIAAQFNNSAEIEKKIQIMEKQFKAARPTGRKKSENLKHLNLSKELVQEFMEVAHFDNPLNPFKNPDIRFRNYLMFRLMENHGIRSGELLSLKLTHLTLHGNKKSFWVRRNQDDIYDARKIQRVAKTKERMLIISDETADLISFYIIELRKKLKNSMSHPYLFVTHRKGKTEGLPLSGSTFDNTIFSTMKKVSNKFSALHPHYFRHNWNEIFSEKVDENNKLASEGHENYQTIDSGTEAKMRMHLMGHSSESSGNIYNQRHITRKANELLLAEQRDLIEKVKEKCGVGHGGQHGKYK